jgi:hypothetical protein
MITKYSILLVFLFSFGSATAETQKYDWNYYEEFTPDKGDVLFLFFSASSIEKIQDGHIKVWAKGVPKRDVKKVFIKNKESIIRTPEKVITLLPQYPDAYKSKNVNNDNSLALIFLEYIVNNFKIDPRVQWLYELNCKEKTLRVLTVRVYEGRETLQKEGGEWRHVAPDTYDYRLMGAVCS